MLKALFRQLDAFAKAADDGTDAHAALRAPQRRRLGDAYMERRGRHRLAVGAALQDPAFLSKLVEGLAGVNICGSDPGVTKELVAAAAKLDVLSEEGAKQLDAARSPKRRRRGAA